MSNQETMAVALQSSAEPRPMLLLSRKTVPYSVHSTHYVQVHAGIQGQALRTLPAGQALRLKSSALQARTRVSLCRGASPCAIVASPSLRYPCGCFHGERQHHSPHHGTHMPGARASHFE